MNEQTDQERYEQAMRRMRMANMMAQTTADRRREQDDNN